MKIKSYRIRFKTKGYCDIHNVTEKACAHLTESSVANGQATFFVAGSTAGLTTVEYEPGLIKDLKEFYERLSYPN